MHEDYIDTAILPVQCVLTRINPAILGRLARWIAMTVVAIHLLQLITRKTRRFHLHINVPSRFSALMHEICRRLTVRSVQHCSSRSHATFSSSNRKMSKIILRILWLSLASANCHFVFMQLHPFNFDFSAARPLCREISSSGCLFLTSVSIRGQHFVSNTKNLWSRSTVTIPLS